MMTGDAAETTTPEPDLTVARVWYQAATRPHKHTHPARDRHAAIAPPPARGRRALSRHPFANNGRARELTHTQTIKTDRERERGRERERERERERQRETERDRGSRITKA